MQTILNSNITTKESEIIMNQIVFSAGFVQANIFCSLLCILLPILFVWYQKRKNGVKPGAFFIGAAFCLLFSYVAATIVNVLIFSIPWLLSFFSTKNHPVYSALFLPWYSFNHRSIYRIEVCNEKTPGQGKCADFRSWYGRF